MIERHIGGLHGAYKSSIKHPSNGSVCDVHRITSLRDALHKMRLAGAQDSSRQILLKSVLFATDFSAASMRALPYAVGMAKQYGAKLYVAHVVPIESYLLGDAQAVERLRLARQEAESNLANIVQSP